MPLWDSDQVRAQRVGPSEPPEQARRPVSIVQFASTAIITVPYSLAQRKMCREYYYNKGSYGINEKRVDPERSEIDK